MYYVYVRRTLQVHTPLLHSHQIPPVANAGRPRKSRISVQSSPITPFLCPCCLLYLISLRPVFVVPSVQVCWCPSVLQRLWLVRCIYHLAPFIGHPRDHSPSHFVHTPHARCFLPLVVLSSPVPPCKSHDTDLALNLSAIQDNTLSSSYQLLFVFFSTLLLLHQPPATSCPVTCPGRRTSAIFVNGRLVPSASPPPSPATRLVFRLRASSFVSSPLPRLARDALDLGTTSILVVVALGLALASGCPPLGDVYVSFFLSFLHRNPTSFQLPSGSNAPRRAQSYTAICRSAFLH